MTMKGTEMFETLSEDQLVLLDVCRNRLSLTNEQIAERFAGLNLTDNQILSALVRDMNSARAERLMTDNEEFAIIQILGRAQAVNNTDVVKGCQKILADPFANSLVAGRWVGRVRRMWPELGSPDEVAEETPVVEEPTPAKTRRTSKKVAEQTEY